MLKSPHEIRRGAISGFELRRRCLPRHRLSDRPARRIHLAPIRAGFRLRRHHPSGRVCLRRLSAHRRDRAIFSGDEGRRRVCAVGRAGPRHLQRIPDSSRSGTCCPARCCATGACDFSAGRCTCAWKTRTRRSPAPRVPGKFWKCRSRTWKGTISAMRRRSPSSSAISKSFFATSTPDGRDAGPDDFDANPNGALHAIAGLCNRERNVVGLMPHPERAVEVGARLGGRPRDFAVHGRKPYARRERMTVCACG